MGDTASGRILVYGSYGYTGDLIARYAKGKKIDVTLAGRDRVKLQAQAAELDLPTKVFAIDDVDAAARAIQGFNAVIHCAGPFAHTAREIADACIKAGAHYLDITGEVQVFEAMAKRDGQAKSAGVMLMPGVGFDVVPSDCLAAHLKRRLPTATHLVLAFHALGGGLSRGTALTMAENAHKGGLIRKEGRLTPVPAAWKTRRIDFGDGRPVLTVTIPWGDVSTAYHSTGIPNIEVYAWYPPAMIRGMVLTRRLGFLIGWSPIQSLVRGRIMKGKAGPTSDEREKGVSRLWGEALDQGAGKTVSARLVGPETYKWTYLTAVHIVERILAGDAPPGFQTPSKAFGPDLILEVGGAPSKQPSAILAEGVTGGRTSTYATRTDL